ncbi:hypothetical protein [Candidiatus Paracoxiella cheracis]|uniref:hypothetical protein n=1 Tax=Candidiatus Paracoxiella cheracis TaxID=3405120 RepID=UPI003BF5284C
MMSAFYNPKQGGCRNFIRMLSIPATLFFIMRMIDWWSGLSMSFEAEGIDLNDEMGGILAFLNNFYPKMLQLYAGSILNGCAVATFCGSVLPSIKPVNNFFNWVLRVTGATETPRSEAENAETDHQQLLERHVNSEVGPELQTAVRKSEAVDRIKKRFKDQPATATLVETSLSEAKHTPRLSFLGMFTLKPTYPGVQGSAEDHRYGCMDRVYRVLGW